MKSTKTLRLRIKDKHAKVLAAMAREVNQVWISLTQYEIMQYINQGVLHERNLEASRWGRWN